MKAVVDLMLDATKEPRSPVEDMLVTAVVQLQSDLSWLALRVNVLEEKLATQHKSDDK